MHDNWDLFASDARTAAVDALHAATAIYTCDPVVEQLLDCVAWPKADRHLVDSSCGDGAFLVLALERLLAAQPELGAGEVLARISGWEIHPFAADQARRRVAAVLAAHGWERSAAARLSHQVVRCGDFLTEGPQEPAYDVVVGNPPYLRFLNVPQPLRADYERELPGYAQADLLHGFLDRCARVLRADGELAMVTADRWLLNQGAAGVREAIGRRFRLAQLRRLDAASSFYRPKLRRAGSPPRVHPCAVVLHPSRGTPITAAPIYPGAGLEVARAAQVLGDVAHVRLGPWLGTPGIFLVDAQQAAALPRSALIPAVDVDDIEDGVIRHPTRFALRTSPDETPPEEVLAHLAREMRRMSARGRRSRVPWLPPEPFHRMDTDQPSLLVPRIARSLVPVRVPAGVLAVNHHLSIVPRDGLAGLDAIAAALASPQADEWFRTVTAPLEGGFRAVTARALRTLPFAA